MNTNIKPNEKEQNMDKYIPYSCIHIKFINIWN